MKAMLCAVLFSLSSIASGATVIIRGQPAPLEYQNDFYNLPQTFNIPQGTTQMYITMDGIDKLCILNTADSDIFEMVSRMNILVHGIKTEWNCFPFITTVEEVLP
jgi:hypothetical protein